MLKLTILGNLGGDPDLRYSANGQPVLRFTVASNGRVKTPEGDWQDRTEWVRVSVFGQRAETLAQHLRRGMKVYVAGRLEARPWTDQQGQVRAGLEVIAADVEFMSPRQVEQTGMVGPSRPMPERVAVGAGAGRASHQPRPAAGGDLEDVSF